MNTIEEKKSERKLSREERRLIEKISRDAETTYNRMCQKFFEFFVNHDNPEGPEVEEKRKQMNAQWKMYCHRMKLIPAAIVMFEDYCKGVIKDYQDSKENQLKPETIST